MTKASNTRSIEENFYSDIFVLDMMFDFSDNNTKSKKFIVDRGIEMGLNKKFSIKVEKTVLLMKAVIKKIYDCKYIIKEDKDKLKKLYNI